MAKKQKFQAGDRVRIVKVFYKNEYVTSDYIGKEAEIVGSYADLYPENVSRNRDYKKYRIEHLWEKNGSAWWYENELELVNNIE